MNNKEIYDAFAGIDEELVRSSSPEAMRSRGSRSRRSGDNGKKNPFPVIITVVLLAAGIAAGVIISMKVRGKVGGPSSSGQPLSSGQPALDGPTATPWPTSQNQSTDSPEPTPTEAAIVYVPAPTFKLDSSGWPGEIPWEIEEPEQYKKLAQDVYTTLVNYYPELAAYDKDKLLIYTYNVHLGKWVFSYSVAAGGIELKTYRLERDGIDLKLEVNNTYRFPDAVCRKLQSITDEQMEAYIAQLESAIRSQMTPGKFVEVEDLRSNMALYWTMEDGVPVLKCEAIINTLDPESTEFGCMGHNHFFAQIQVDVDGAKG